jgi:hypothetical protein
MLCTSCCASHIYPHTIPRAVIPKQNSDEGTLDLRAFAKFFFFFIVYKVELKILVWPFVSSIL